MRSKIVSEECVDVELMINQMKELFKDERNTWDRIKIKKLERLNNLLQEVKRGISNKEVGNGILETQRLE